MYRGLFVCSAFDQGTVKLCFPPKLFLVFLLVNGAYYGCLLNIRVMRFSVSTQTLGEISNFVSFFILGEISDIFLLLSSECMCSW